MLVNRNSVYDKKLDKVTCRDQHPIPRSACCSPGYMTACCWIFSCFSSCCRSCCTNFCHTFPPKANRCHCCSWPHLAAVVWLVPIWTPCLRLGNPAPGGAVPALQACEVFPPHHQMAQKPNWHGLWCDALLLVQMTYQSAMQAAGQVLQAPLALASQQQMRAPPQVACNVPELLCAVHYHMCWHLMQLHSELTSLSCLHCCCYACQIAPLHAGQAVLHGWLPQPVCCCWQTAHQHVEVKAEACCPIPALRLCNFQQCQLRPHLSAPDLCHKRMAFPSGIVCWCCWPGRLPATYWQHLSQKTSAAWMTCNANQHRQDVESKSKNHLLVMLYMHGLNRQVPTSNSQDPDAQIQCYVP